MGAIIPFPHGNNNKLALRNSRFSLPPRNVRQVMSSPPTVAWGSSSTLAHYWPASNTSDASVDNPAYLATAACFSFTRAGGFVSGQTFPAYKFIGGTNVNYGAGSLSYNSMGVIFDFTGTNFEIFMGGYGQSLLIKADDKYVTLTEKTFAADGSLNYGKVTFGSAATRRIELLFNAGSLPCFGGIYTDEADTVQPGVIRGPRIIFPGDSFIEGANIPTGAASNCVQIFSEIMGWDDFWSSGVGGTGYLTTSGSRPNYFQRLDGDVIQWKPDGVFFAGGTNDGTKTAAQIAAGMLACAKYIQAALPNCLIGCISPFLSVGAPYAGAYLLQARPLMKAAIESIGGIFLDVQQMPVPAGMTLQTAVLTSGASAGATSLGTNVRLSEHQHYQFDDGSEVLVGPVSGGGSPYTVSVDKCANTQLSGARLTQVGDCLWRGNGYVGHETGVGNCDVITSDDGIHPSQFGQQVMGGAIATAFLNQLYSN